MLLGVLGLLTAVGYLAVTGTTRRWFEKDLDLRSSLAVQSARVSLARSWSANHDRLVEALADITRDERIVGAAACTLEGQLLAATAAYPPQFTCADVALLRTEPVQGETRWSTTADLPSGPVRINATVVDDRDASLGVVVLVHDLAFIERRESTTRSFVLVALLVLAVAASAVTLLGVRLARRGWMVEVRRALTGDAPSEFLPLLRDVRELAARLAGEHDREARAGRWSAARLRSTLTEVLHGERVVILANREPYIHERTEDGVRVAHPASGLVSALEPVMRACSGVWVAHGAGSADRETVDEADRVRVPPGEEAYVLRRVWLSQAQENGYYYGFSNEGLWPLCHVAHTRPIFRAEDREQYVAVNQKFADAVCAEVDTDDPIILVQDYHFALAPRMIRERLPRATIIAFWHIPWPNAERLGPSEQGERMQSMRRIVSEFNVYRWAGRMLVDAAELRRKHRVSGRLASDLQRDAP